ncbi:MAG: hypothetical protein HQK84_00480 [Nitrospinae bacterium]|nr:hypothetical protein [Nitrospinota bacterium]
MKGRYLFLLTSTVLLFLVSCGVTNQKLRMSGVQNYVFPDIYDWNVKTGLFIFHSPTNSMDVAYGFSQRLHKKMLTRSLFKTITFVDLQIGNDELALRKGKELGFDYVIYGSVNERVFVVRADETKPFVSMSMKILDTKTGTTLWYIDDSITGDAPMYKRLVGMDTYKDYPSVMFLEENLITNVVNFLAEAKTKLKRQLKQ